MHNVRRFQLIPANEMNAVELLSFRQFGFLSPPVCARGSTSLPYASERPDLNEHQRATVVSQAPDDVQNMLGSHGCLGKDELRPSQIRVIAVVVPAFAQVIYDQAIHPAGKNGSDFIRSAQSITPMPADPSLPQTRRSPSTSIPMEDDSCRRGRSGPCSSLLLRSPHIDDESNVRERDPEEHDRPAVVPIK